MEVIINKRIMAFMVAITLCISLFPVIATAHCDMDKVGHYKSDDPFETNGFFERVDGISGAVAVSTMVVNGGVDSTMALTADGDLYAWGFNLHGVLVSVPD